MSVTGTASIPGDPGGGSPLSPAGGEVAEGCLAEAKANGVQLGCGMYNAVLRGYLAEDPERPEEVKRLFGEMQELQARSIS